MADGQPKRDRIDWAAAECVFVPIYRPECPVCDSQEFVHIRGESNGDGSTTERVICASCSTPYKIVREPALPDSGNPDF